MSASNKNKGPTGRSRISKAKRRPLQGARLRKAALARLDQLVLLSPKTDRISVARLARDLGVSRPAIYNNGLQGVVQEYGERQRANFAVAVEAQAKRAPLERAIPKLETENQELRKKLDGLAQWWVYWARHALRQGIQPELIFSDGGPVDSDWPVPPAPEIPLPKRSPRSTRGKPTRAKG